MLVEGALREGITTAGDEAVGRSVEATNDDKEETSTLISAGVVGDEVDEQPNFSSPLTLMVSSFMAASGKAAARDCGNSGEESGGSKFGSTWRSKELGDGIAAAPEGECTPATLASVSAPVIGSLCSESDIGVGSATAEEVDADATGGIISSRGVACCCCSRRWTAIEEADAGWWYEEAEVVCVSGRAADGWRTEKAGSSEEADAAG